MTPIANPFPSSAARIAVCRSQVRSGHTRWSHNRQRSRPGPPAAPHGSQSVGVRSGQVIAVIHDGHIIDRGHGQVPQQRRTDRSLSGLGQDRSGQGGVVIDQLKQRLPDTQTLTRVTHTTE